jgi:hypothetical protein
MRDCYRAWFQHSNPTVHLKIVTILNVRHCHNWISVGCIYYRLKSIRPGKQTDEPHTHLTITARRKTSAHCSKHRLSVSVLFSSTDSTLSCVGSTPDGVCTRMQLLMRRCDKNEMQIQKIEPSWVDSHTAAQMPPNLRLSQRLVSDRRHGAMIGDVCRLYWSA